MMVNWRIIETDNKVLPVNSYSAKIFVKESDNKTKVIYKSGFYRGFMGNDPPAELNDENSKKKVKIFIVENLNGLKKIIEKIKYILCSLIIICFNPLIPKELAFITNQESNMLDVIDLTIQKKLKKLS